MWAIDHPSMIVIILAGFHLGLMGLFGINVAERLFGDYTNVAYAITGVAAFWQLTRQRFPI